MVAELSVGVVLAALASLLALFLALGQGGVMGYVFAMAYIIGVWSGSLLMYHEYLVQLYTYTPLLSSSNNVGNSLVAQINLPQSYGGIYIAPIQKGIINKAINSFKSRTLLNADYQKYTFEWLDFNNRYQVFATDAGRLATFELLNPGFMAYLYDSDPAVTIEVTDNIVYLYKDSRAVQVADYEKMMTILNTAFRELRL